MFKPWLKNLIKTKLPETAVFRLSAYDHLLRGEPELRLLPYLCDAAKNAVDIGANIGSYSYFMRKYARHVYAYEPHPELAGRLVRLLPSVTVRCAAVSDGRQKTLILRVPIRNGHQNHELASVEIDYRRWEEVKEYVVPCVCIDDEDIDNVGLIKIDVEQHEISALRGAMKKIRDFRPSIITEINMPIYRKELPDAFDFVINESYVGYIRIGRKFMPLSDFRSSIHSEDIANNMILLPKETNADFLQ